MYVIKGIPPTDGYKLVQRAYRLLPAALYENTPELIRTVGFEVAHRLVQNLENTGLELSDDGRVTGGHAVLARTARDDDLTAANTDRTTARRRYTGGIGKTKTLLIVRSCNGDSCWRSSAYAVVSDWSWQNASASETRAHRDQNHDSTTNFRTP